MSKIGSQFPLVSVMIITYNQKDFISETIDSVLSQDYCNLEIVIADDASTDGTIEILKNYRERFSSIKLVLNQKNIGITGNSNAAFFACTGEFIAILGGDDLFLPGKITAQVKQFLQNSKVVLSYHPVEIFDSKTNKTIFITNQLAREDRDSAIDIIRKQGIAGASSIMVRRAACPRHGFDPQIPTASDWIFSIEVALKGQVVKLNGVYGKYRKHDNNVGNQLHKYFNEFIDTLDIIAERYKTFPSIQSACTDAKARLFAGEAFRNLSTNRKMAAKNFASAIGLRPYNIRYLIGFIVAKSSFLASLVFRFKYSIKKYFG